MDDIAISELYGNRRIVLYIPVVWCICETPGNIAIGGFRQLCLEISGCENSSGNFSLLQIEPSFVCEAKFNLDIGAAAIATLNVENQQLPLLTPQAIALFEKYSNEWIVLDPGCWCLL
ncbi:hypothetical protein T05_2355 [Trichinella murrelli]|uniref:Uncharacterized protein n=1 Tax=Trichinella murrelli TaxID=144512 RepID=A0A0V0UFZ3_9BILA|nr:hypothetical protein T05_2355 [Trichinella murrelli]